MTQFKQNM